MFTYEDVNRLLIYTYKTNIGLFENNFELVIKKNKEMFDIMRHNFSRFWYYCTYEERIKWIELSESNIDYYDNFNKLIRYVYEVTVEEFDKVFYNGLYFELNIDMLSYDKEKYIDKLMLFKNDIVLFWTQLDNNEKEKFINLVDKYDLVILEEKENILFNKSQIKEKYIQWKNEINNLDYEICDLDDIIELDTDENDSDHFDSDDDNQSCSSDISIVNNLDSNIKIFYCNRKNLKKLDNLPCELKMLYCQENKLTSLDLLPSELIYLKCRNNKIKNLENLPMNLLYLDAGNNMIKNINCIPSKLLFLNLSRNKRITELNNLPNSLLYLDISLIENVRIEEYPINLKYLDITGTKISNYNILPSTIEELYCDDDKLYCIKYFPNNIEYIDCNCSYDSTIIVPFGYSNVKEHNIKYIHYF